MTKQQILKQYFGYDQFREGQDFLIDQILKGHDVVGIMPTGAGKSLCFQVPALLFDGITLVISPLISLMQDQIQTLNQMGISSAFLNSSLTSKDYASTLYQVKQNNYKMLYVTPERLLSSDFLELSQQLPIKMITIDEAHCISHWGQDFRPSYLKISDFIDHLKTRPIISAFTATATALVREDIIQALRLNNPQILITGFNRKNLYFEVQKPKDKFATLLNLLEEQQEKSGIIYCATRKVVENLHEHLEQLNFSVTRYHAGLSDQERKKNQEDFIFDRKQIMIATNAFGMGIDKSNVAFVIHYNMPKSLEHYYQEAGRAGRDGEQAKCILLYSPKDVETNKFLIENNENGDLHTKEQDYERLKQITFYCTTNTCLREFILNYFGEKNSHFCGACYNCNTHFETVNITVEAQKILSCIKRIKQYNNQHYGIGMVSDILRGANTEKIKRLKLDSLSTYNLMSNVSKKDLKDMIYFLAQQDYVHITNDEYPVLYFGNRARSVLFEGEQLYIKRIKQLEKVPPIASSQLKESTIYSNLMKKLKILRLELANQQDVPAFVIFSDATLVDMCKKLPTNESEFLNVSGIGQIKLARYGDVFLKEINHFLGNNITKESTLGDLFSYIRENILLVEEPISISIFVRQINEIISEKYTTKLLIKKVSSWLMDNNYLSEELNDFGKYHKVPTDQGLKIGISNELRAKENATTYHINLYNKNAQQILLDNLEDLF
jgi:ATP-dependent DNA helicase RecQ